MLSNPIVKRVFRERRKPSLTASLSLTLLLWIACLIVIFTASALISSQSIFDGVLIFRYALFWGTAFLPLGVMIAAAVIMNRARERNDFTLLRQSLISDQAITQGYALTILYRLRLPLVLATGLLPLLTLVLLIPPASTGILRPFAPKVICPPGLIDFITLLPMAIWLLGLCLFGVVSGVLMVLRWGRSGLRAALGTAGILLVYTIILATTDPQTALPGVAYYNFPLQHFVSRRLPSLPLLAILVMLLPFGLSLLAARTLWREAGNRKRRSVEMWALAGVLLLLLAADFAAVDLVTHHKRTLIDEMGRSHQTASLHAAHILKQSGWLSDGTLQGVELQNANLAGADLQRANLRGANLRAANLQEAMLLAVDLRASDLFGSNMTGAMMPHANLLGASLRHANLQGADLSFTDLRQSGLEGANLKGANLNHADLQGADLRRAQLQGGDLRYADLQEVNLWAANLGGADLSNANLDGAYNLTCTQLRQTASLEGAILPAAYQIAADDWYEAYGIGCRQW